MPSIPAGIAGREIVPFDGVASTGVATEMFAWIGAG